MLLIVDGHSFLFHFKTVSTMGATVEYDHTFYEESCLFTLNVICTYKHIYLYLFSCHVTVVI
jgi:hypothetical protein